MPCQNRGAEHIPIPKAPENPFYTVGIKTIPTESQGSLQFFEGSRDIPFEIKRIYYISGVPEGVWRGAHAHKQLKQFIFCPYGNVLLKLSNGQETFEMELNRPDMGLVIQKPLWRDMLWLQENSVLCVAASDYYDAADYIRNYKEFLAYIEEQKK